MGAHNYLHVDVFTEKPFEGNQLAVFPDGRGLEPATMQAIAKEMNFAETTFILPAEGRGDVRMRIFTPEEELPMAGHPTVGSTFALAHLGKIKAGQQEFVFELGVGPTPVALEWGDGGGSSQGALRFAWMTQRQPEFGRSPSDLVELAAALGVESNDLADGPPPQEVSCGVPFFFVRLASRKGVDAVEVDRRALTRFYERHSLRNLPVFVFTTDHGADEATCYSRMFAPGFGIVEDPATGGASGPLGAYLVHHGVVSPKEGGSLLSLQGRKMGRPSWIHIQIGTNEGTIDRVRVGGKSIVIGEGILRF
jgi:trans-2,3-dihydro-3-hydroxyanthranilate isomerase